MLLISTVNFPLYLLVRWKISKPFANRAMVFLLAFSGFLALLDLVDLSAFVYDTTISTLLGPAVAGMISGFCGYYMHQMGTCMGGTEFIAKLIHKRNPSFNFFTIIFTLNAVVAAASYFVYDYKIEPVILCILYSFTSSTITDRMTKSGRSAVRFEIVTEHPDEISNAIIHKLRHGATLLPGKGVYQGRETNVLICVVSRGQAAALSEIVRATPHTFAVMSQVNQVFGDFKDRTSHSHSPMNLLDTGDADLTS